MSGLRYGGMMYYGELIEKAKEARERAYAPYSEFTVGAALLCNDGSIYTGCNIENASYGATICAERTAIFKAVSEGEGDFTAIAIVGAPIGRPIDFCPPCGMCRQVMTEFCDDERFKIVLSNGSEEQVYTLKELMPHSFDSLCDRRG